MAWTKKATTTLITRNGATPQIHPGARIAASATIVGDVRIDAGAYVDHGVVIESGGPPVEIAAEVIVFAGSVIRSVGGRGRPAFPVRIGTRSLVSPRSALTGCEVGSHCYLATGVIVLQGAVVGDRGRIGAGAIVHAETVLPEEARIGMRHIAAATRGRCGQVLTPVGRGRGNRITRFDDGESCGRTDRAHPLRFPALRFRRASHVHDVAPVRRPAGPVGHSLTGPRTLGTAVSREAGLLRHKT